MNDATANPCNYHNRAYEHGQRFRAEIKAADRFTKGEERYEHTILERTADSKFDHEGKTD